MKSISLFIPWRILGKIILLMYHVYPPGLMKVTPYDGSKFKDVYRLRDVKDRSAILIHRGNHEKDTQGCIIPGLGVDMSLSEPMVTNSVNAMNMLRTLIGKNEFTLTIE
jgi:hypothetical protein